ncbi:MAG: hypothetical protein JWO94_2211, partial [Verrucomicrobiaceae bacterium]|nr:hypothetical protein [Verrucomicrobiaceae bacterium]
MDVLLPVPLRRFFLSLAMGAAGTGAFAAQPAPMPAVETPPVWLGQGWSRSDSERFYSTTQGSHLLPLAFFAELEQAGNTRPFNSPEITEKYRCIPRPKTTDNPYGLPVGFVPDKGSKLPSGLLADSRSMGFTCAACHTAQINYRGTVLRIDGGPTLADFDGWTVALAEALTATANHPDKFARFAKKVLKDEAGNADKRKAVFTALQRTAADRHRYLDENHSPVPYGYARLDAFGRIFNTALSAIESKSRITPNAPVSFPFLWDTGRCDTVQWTGNTPNPFPGSLARNVGEVVGVFGAIDTTDKRPPYGYASSVRFDDLLRLEKLVRHLQPPAWPAKILGPVDARKADAGKALFATHCADCHKKISSWTWLPFVET